MRGAPSQAIAIDRSLGIALHRQVETAFRAAIADGRLRAGAVVASTRALAEDLGIARITVATAYDQLVAEGYLEAQPRRRTRVAADLPAHGFPDPGPRSRPFEARTPEPNAWAPRAPITMDDALPGDEIDLGPESFSLAMLDHRAWERRLVGAWRELAGEPAGPAASYFGGLGDPVLRAALADYLMVHRGVRARAESIVVTAGASAILAAVARTWLGPGRRCVVEEPGGEQLRRSLASAGAELIPVKVDDDGLDPKGLPSAADVVFVTPSWQYPRGGRMSVARRLTLLAWARRAGCLIVEDDCEGELRYAGHPLPTLQGLGEDGRVIYVNTFSKVLFPGLRTGYAVVPDAHRGPLLAAIEAGGRPAGALEQRALGRFIESGAYQRHLRRLRAHYATLRSAFEAELLKASAGRLRVHPGEAGGHVLVDVAPGGPPATMLAAEVRALGVRLQPLRANLLATVGRDDALVVYLTRATEADVRQAASRLAQVAARLTARGGGRSRSRAT